MPKSATAAQHTLKKHLPAGLPRTQTHTRTHKTPFNFNTYLLAFPDFAYQLPYNDHVQLSLQRHKSALKRFSDEMKIINNSTYP